MGGFEHIVAHLHKLVTNHVLNTVSRVSLFVAIWSLPKHFPSLGIMLTF